jgi:hypothetical protein
MGHLGGGFDRCVEEEEEEGTGYPLLDVLSLVLF